MSLTEFYMHLKALPKKGWKPYMAGPMIRLRFKNREMEHDPVTAVCLDRTGKKVSMWNDKTDKAVELLHLDILKIVPILQASWLGVSDLTDKTRRIKRKIRNILRV